MKGVVIARWRTHGKTVSNPEIGFWETRRLYYALETIGDPQVICSRLVPINALAFTNRCSREADFSVPIRPTF